MPLQGEAYLELFLRIDLLPLARIHLALPYRMPHRLWHALSAMELLLPSLARGTISA